MSGDCIARIDKLENGYTVEVYDQDTADANNKPKNTSYESPWKEYAFETGDKVIEFLTKHINSLKPPPDADTQFSDAFDTAASAEDD